MKPLVVGHCDFNENQSEMEQKVEKGMLMNNKNKMLQTITNHNVTDIE